MGGLLGGGGQEKQAKALADATRSYEAYRPDAYNAQMNAMGNAMSAFQGANNALETLWGAPPQQGHGGMRHLKAAPATPMGMMGRPPAPPPQVAQPQQGESFNPIKALFDPLGLF